MKAQQKAIVGGVVLFVIYFALLPVVTGSEGWNDSAVYATLFKTLVPVGIALGTALVAIQTSTRA